MLRAELRHRSDVDHLRMNCDEKRGGGTDRAESQLPELRAVYDDEVIFLLNLRNGRSDAL